MPSPQKMKSTEHNNGNVFQLTFCLSVSTKPESPYGAYNGQLRSAVYQPTELALIAKGLTRVSTQSLVYTKKHLLITISKIIPTIRVSTGGPRRNDTSSHSPQCDSTKQQLPASFSWVLIILRTVTGWQIESRAH